MSAQIYRERVHSLCEVMRKRGAGCIILNGGKDVEHFTGIRNVCTWLFILANERLVGMVLESDLLDYQRQNLIVQDVRTFRVHDPVGLWRNLAEELHLGEGSIVASTHMSHVYYQMFHQAFGSKLNESLGLQYLMAEMELTHSPEAMKKLARASELAVLGLRTAREQVAAGMSEQELAARVQSAMRDAGADKGGYTYVGADGRSPLAHHPATDNVIEHGPVSIDIHVAYQGYHSDMARTLFLPCNTAEQRGMYDYLRERLGQTIALVKPGMTMLEMKRSFYRGFHVKPDWVPLSGPFAHGVGTSNYVAPSFNWPHQVKGYPEVIEEGMVLAASNLGLASKHGWGVRYEDTFAVTAEGAVVLSQEA